MNTVNNLEPNFLYDISVEATGSSQGTWSASVDPQVEIDPTFEYADDFTVAFSPDDTATATPELGTGSFMLIGIGLVLVMRKRLAQAPPKAS